ncbi:MAG: ribonuclease H-like domain-containing protein [Patescibacteria group bacterium]
MRTLILDIETVGESWDSLDAVTQNSLRAWIDRKVRTNEEREGLLTTVQNELGLSPFTGRIVALGVYDLERAHGAVYYVGTGGESDEVVGDFILKNRSEASLLEEFWEGAREYDTFVTFNGRAFAMPYIIHRSLSHGIQPTQELMKYRYLTQQSMPYHIDVLDELTWYGAMRNRPTLHLLCRSYGITSPNLDGIRGTLVANLFSKKQFRDIALYNLKDVVAIKELYTVWLKNLAPVNFLATLDF